MKDSGAIQHLLKEWISPSYVMMVGVPGVGKSTFLKKFLEHLHEPVYIASTDDYVESEAKRLGITYSEAFQGINQKQSRLMMNEGVIQAINDRKTIFHDQTNMSRKSRASKLALVPSTYHRVCLNFTVDDRELQKRLDERATLTGKVIPPDVLKNMYNSYVAPTCKEGFNTIIEIDNS